MSWQMKSLICSIIKCSTTLEITDWINNIRCNIECNILFLLLFRGRTPEYYSKAIGPFLASSVAKVRDTFQYGSDGPETKV